MKIFSSAQVKQWDTYTIAHEPIASIDLMERAATACYQWIIGHHFAERHFRIFCGKGNNGGDGLAIARLLIQNNCSVSVYILDPIAIGFGNIGTADFQTNLEKLHQCNADIHFIQSPEFFPRIDDTDMVIDALFGSGLNKPLEGISAALVHHINETPAEVISVDLPTGLYADKSSTGNAIIMATHTLSFQHYKAAFLLRENENYIGDVHLMNIGLHKDFEQTEPAAFEMTDDHIIRTIYKARSKSAHKGNFGHAAILSGSEGMMGAAVLSSLACLRSGAGKLTTYIPKCGNEILQTAVPEAMTFIAGEDRLLSAPGIEKYNAVAIGPGIGMHPSHKKLLGEIFNSLNTPMVIDADALNFIAENQVLLDKIPAHSILTPHPKEFERLFGKTDTDFDRLQLALQKSKDLNLYIVLKGHYSFISTPDGRGFFNCTGNPGMATAGSGDVLTGILTGLLAQGYTPLQACVLGVYLHGLAGDIAAAKFSEEAMIAGDITDCLGDAYKQVHSF